MIYGTEQPHELRVNSYKPELKVKVVVRSFRLLIQLEHWGSLRLKLSKILVTLQDIEKIYGLQAQAVRQD